MENINEVTYCGLYCPNCSARCELPRRASALIEILVEGEYDEWAHGLEGFTEFWKFLHGLVEGSPLKNCRSKTCGFPGCGIRKCAQAREVAACPLCADYPCQMIETFAGSEPTLIDDGVRMAEIGLPRWIQEQEIRRQKGFNYGMVRIGKSTIPIG